MSNFNYIIEKAKKPARTWTNVEKVQFHYFNENGLYKQWRRMCDTITGYVNAGIIPSGWHLAYGSLNSYTSDRLTKDLHSKKRVGNTEAKVTFERLQEQIDKGYTKLGEFIIGDE